MNDDIKERLNRLERESRIWRFAFLALLAGVLASAVKADSPDEFKKDGYMAMDGEKNGEFNRIHAEQIVADSLIVKGQLFVVKKGGSPDGDHISIYVDPNPTVMAQKGQSAVSMVASSSGGEMYAYDSSGKNIMQFPPPKP
jgi:hypothetical protein